MRRAIQNLNPPLLPDPRARVYHGFQVLSDVVVEGFTFGKITNFEAEPSDTGDAFVIASDDSRAGLVWEVSDKYYLQESARWIVNDGVFGPFRFPTQ